MRPHTLPSLPLNPGPRRWTLWGLSSSCWQCIGSPASQAPWCVAARGPGGWLLLAHTQPFPRVPCTHSTLLAIQVTPLWSPLWCLAAALLNVPAVLVLASRRSAAWCESEELRAEVPEAWHPPPSAPWLRWLIALPSPPPPPPLLPNRYVARREAVRLAWWVVALSFQQVNKNYTVMERFQVRVLRGGWAGRALLLHSSTCGPQLRPTHPPTPFSDSPNATRLPATQVRGAPMSEAAPRKRSAHDLQQHQQQQQQPGGGLAVGQPPKRLQPSADYALQASSGAAWAHAPLHAWPTN